MSHIARSMSVSFESPSASYEHFRTLEKGLRHVVPHALLMPRIARIEAKLGDTRNPRVSLLTIRSLVEDLTRQVGDPLLMVRAFSHLNYRPTFLRRTFLSGGRSMAEAIALMRRYMGVCTDLGQIELSVERGETYLRLSPDPAFTADPQQLDSMLYAVLRTLLGLGLRSKARATLPHTPDLALQPEYQSLFPVPLSFGADGYGIHFPAIELARPLSWDGDDVNRLARRERKLVKLHPEHRWRDSVAVLLAVLLRNGEGTIDRCAQLLAASRRTLQRRIEAEGVTFRELLEDTRRRLALDYVARGYSSDAVALLIGYRQPSQFYRSFRGWFGCSPNDFRNRPCAMSAADRSLPPLPAQIWSLQRDGPQP